MTLNYGVDMVAIPGPSIVPNRVREAMAKPMPNIYAGALLDISDHVLERLPAIARTQGHPFVITSNGHGAWQMVVSNTLVPGDKILVLESGRFAAMWGEYAAMAGIEVETLAGDFHSPVDPNRVAERLAADDSEKIVADRFRLFDQLADGLDFDLLLLCGHVDPTSLTAEIAAIDN